jgi:hypothetical protein
VFLSQLRTKAFLKLLKYATTTLTGFSPGGNNDPRVEGLLEESPLAQVHETGTNIAPEDREGTGAGRDAMDANLSIQERSVNLSDEAPITSNFLAASTKHEKILAVNEGDPHPSSSSSMQSSVSSPSVRESYRVNSGSPDARSIETSPPSSPNGGLRFSYGT